MIMEYMHPESCFFKFLVKIMYELNDHKVNSMKKLKNYVNLQ